MYGQLTLLVIAAIVSPTIIAIAGIVVAIVVVIGGVLVYRSGKNKGTKTPGSAGQTDWQRQSQLGGAGNWNQQAMGNNMGGMNSDAPPWAQQSQQGGQGSWNHQGMAQQAQQAQPGTWGAGQDVQSQAPSWAAQSNQAAPTWGTQNNPPPTQQPAWMQGVQQSSSPSWAAQNNQAQQPAANSWANPGFQSSQGPQGAQTNWDVNQPIAAQDSWGMQVPGMAQNQGMQPRTSYGGGNASAPSWNQPGGSGVQNPQNGPNDAWSAGTPQAPQAPYASQSANNALAGFSAVPTSGPSQSPSWQQNSGYGQGNAGQAGQAGMMGGNAAGRQAPSFGENSLMSDGDNDRTILRTPGTGLGIVRVEEGKEPGREYEIRKDSLSIGRSRESDIFLEDLAVSRLHASIVSQGNGNYALKDEGSANGTKINGQLVGKFQTFPLQDGDRIQLGQTVLVFGHR